MAAITAAKTNSASTGSAPLSVWNLVTSVRTYVERRNHVNDTIRELESLTDRELNDIGISRYDIRRLAEEAAGAAKS